MREGDLAVSPPGRVVTGRSHPALLGHKGTTRADGMPLGNGRPWPEPDVQADVRKIVGARAASIHNETAERSDVLPLLVATDELLFIWFKTSSVALPISLLPPFILLTRKLLMGFQGRS